MLSNDGIELLWGSASKLDFWSVSTFTAVTYLGNLLATFEQFERRHSTDTEPLCKLCLLVDIDFLHEVG